MRERRWETSDRLTFQDVVGVGERLGALGLKPAPPAKDVICYVEDWTVDSLDAFDLLDRWATEDVTLIHVREAWQGDFFLLAGGYHTVYQQYQDVGTYCSISHPWRTSRPAAVSPSDQHAVAGVPAQPCVYPRAPADTGSRDAGETREDRAAYRLGR